MPDAYSARVIADGAVAYWRMNEQSGTAIDSLVAGPATGLIAGDVTLKREGGPAGGDYAMLFTAPTGEVTIPDGAYHQFGVGAFSVEFWFKASGVATDHTITNLTTAGGGPGFRASANVNGQHFLVHDGVGLLGVSATANPGGDGKYHHFVGTLTRGGSDLMRIYIDGVLVGGPEALGTVGNTITPGRALGFGATIDDTASSINHWTGTLDEIALYATALSAAKIAEHHTEGRCCPVPVSHHHLSSPMRY